MSDAPLVLGIGEILWDILPSGRQFGGAPANVAFHAHQFGLRSGVCSAVGKDALGDEAIAHLQALGVDCSGVLRLADVATGTAIAELDAAGKSNFTIVEDVAWDRLADSPEIDRLLREANACVVGTLASRSPQSRTTIRSWLDRVPKSCLVVCDLNLRQHYYDADTMRALIAHSSVVKVSDDEWPDVASELGYDSDAVRGCEQLRESSNLSLVALTRGSAGSMLITATETCDHPGTPATVTDTIGAGDSFTATLITGLLRNIPLARIQEAASQVSAYVCGQSGATPTLPNHLTSLVQ